MNPITDAARTDAALIWDYHQMGHDLHACNVAIGLGSHDLGVAEHTAKLYQQGYAPKIVFTGATSPPPPGRSFPTAKPSPTGLARSNSASPRTTSSSSPTPAQNLVFSRAVLHDAGVHPDTVLLVCKPYMQRRAYATCAKAWRQRSPRSVPPDRSPSPTTSPASATSARSSTCSSATSSASSSTPHPRGGQGWSVWATTLRGTSP